MTLKTFPLSDFEYWPNARVLVNKTRYDYLPYSFLIQGERYTLEFSWAVVSADRPRKMGILILPVDPPKGLENLELWYYPPNMEVPYVEDVGLS
jgi:hypothetical protein